MASEDFIDYAKLIDDAMHVIVKQALEKVGKHGLQGGHHFFISFLTQYPGVEVPKALKDQYPDEITIVIQHQFDDLEVTDKSFSVVLSFEHVKEKVSVPFKALTSFADPSVKFGLQFRHYSDLLEQGVEEEEEQVEESTKAKKSTASKTSKTSRKKTTKDAKKQDSNVVSMESFRNKKD